MGNDVKTTIDADLIIKLIVAVITYGGPAVADLIAEFKKENDADPTAEEIHALLDGLKPPEDY